MCEQSDIELRRVTDAVGAASCEQLFVEYVAWVFEQFRTVHGSDLPDARQAIVHAEFRAEYPKLLGDRGRMVLATLRGEPAAVGALKPLSGEASELKRMYVRPAFRGLGLGRRVVDYLVGEARSLGYLTVQLDSADFMTGAHRLYRSAGFVDRPAYQGEAARHGLVAHMLFMTLDLTTSAPLH
ncbi:MAG TPA: GNAT family N-acetyltransferase [Acidimicrobiales bacterium]|nr:GNAT family N-acetyltransferase [Acidimicrobiales bacterium]